MTKAQKIAVWLLIVASVTGLLDSSFLFYKYLNASPIDCLLFDGCNTVAQSSYSRPLGIPLPAVGILFYACVLALLAIYLRLRTALFKDLLLLAGIAGFLFSLFFIYLQGFIIQAFCVYCLISAAAATAVLCAALYVREHPLEPPV